MKEPECKAAVINRAVRRGGSLRRWHLKKDPKKKNHVDMQWKKLPCRRDGQRKGSKEEVCLATLRRSWRPGWLDWSEEGESSRRWRQGGNRRADCLDLRTIMTPRIFTLRERGFQAVEWHNLISIWEQWQSLRLFCDEQMGKGEFRRPPLRGYWRNLMRNDGDGDRCGHQKGQW